MDTFSLRNEVRLTLSHALLLLYRYLTGIYELGDLSFVQFLGGYVRGKNQSLDDCSILTVSGNGIGELERMASMQWKLASLDTMAVTPSQMRIMRFLTDASSREVEQFFAWTHESLKPYPKLQALIASSGLVAYWQQQCTLWQSPELKGLVRLFSGSPWDVLAHEAYDAILLSHAQTLLRNYDVKELLSQLKPGGYLATLTPVVFRPDGLNKQMPLRFSDLPAVDEAKEHMRTEAKRLGYEMPDGKPVHIRWNITLSDAVHIVSFSIPSPFSSLLIGELLIQSLAIDLPEATRLSLLESALSTVSTGEGAGTEALLILIATKEAQ